MNSQADRLPVYRRPEFPEILATALFCALPVLAIQAPRFLTVLAPLAALVLFFAQRYTLGMWPKLSGLAFGWMLALVALIAVSSLWAIEPGEALERAGKVLPLLTGGALLFSVTRTMEGTFFRKYFPAAMIVTAGFLLVELNFGQPLYRIFHPQAPSLLGSKNFSGLNRGIVFFTLFFFPALAVVQNEKRRIIPVLLIAFSYTILFQTDSQSAQVAFLCGMIMYFLFPYKFKAAWVALWSALVAFMLAIPWLAQWGFMQFGAYSAGYNGGWLQNSYASVRLEIWNLLAKYVEQKPLLGYGADATEHLKFNDPRIYLQLDHVLHPHNFMLQLWLEFGIIGPLFAAAFFLAVLSGIYKLDRAAQRPLLATLFASIVAASTSYGLWQGWWLGAFCLLFSCSLLLAQKKTPAV